MRWPPIWRTVPGARRYAVSDCGQVRNGSGVLALRVSDEGYHKLKLIFDDGVRREVFVHKVVALAFLPPPVPGQRYVLHGDRCRTNCRVDNLRWGTHHQNHADKVLHGTVPKPVRKLLPRDVRRIRASAIGAAKLARQMGLSISHVRDVRNGRRWARHAGARPRVEQRRIYA